MKQLEKIFELLGAPNERIWPGVLSLPHVASGTVALRPDRYPYNNLSSKFPHLSNGGVDLLNSFLAYDPNKRLNAADAQRHVYFTKERPSPKEPSMMPTFLSSHEEMMRQEQERERQMLLQGASSSAGGGGGKGGGAGTTGMLLKEDFFSGGGGRGNNRFTSSIKPVLKKAKHAKMS